MREARPHLDCALECGGMPDRIYTMQLPTCATVAAMSCEICDQVERSAERLKREWEHSRGLLEELSGVIDREKYNRLKRLTDEAGLEYELAVTELEQHIAAFHAAVN